MSFSYSWCARSLASVCIQRLRCVLGLVGLFREGGLCVLRFSVVQYLACPSRCSVECTLLAMVVCGSRCCVLLKIFFVMCSNVCAGCPGGCWMMWLYSLRSAMVMVVSACGIPSSARSALCRQSVFHVLGQKMAASEVLVWSSSCLWCSGRWRKGRQTSVVIEH